MKRLAVFTFLALVGWLAWEVSRAPMIEDAEWTNEYNRRGYGPPRAVK